MKHRRVERPSSQIHDEASRNKRSGYEDPKHWKDDACKEAEAE